MEKFEITFKTKTANIGEIQTHLIECNNNFYLPLIDRVDIEDYSRKLYEKSVTFEAWKDHLLIGLIAAYFNKSSTLGVYITNVSVIKEFMGKGIASQMLRNCIEYSNTENFKEILLEVNNQNINAVGLYRKFGFSLDCVENNTIKMRLELTY